MSRILTAFVVLLSVSGVSLSGGQVRSGAPASGRGLQFLEVNDPVYGVEMGKMAFFAGWQGSVGVTRTDAFCPDCNSLSLRMLSPDGSSQIQTFGDGLHTGVYQIPGQKGHFVKTRFTSTGDLIEKYILPGLDVHGQVSAARPALRDKGAVALEEMKRIPVATAPFVQGAAVTVTGTNTGKDYVVEALTLGGSVGLPTEFTVSHFTVIEAPVGRADALARQWEALPAIAVNPVWRQKNDDQTMATLRRMQQQGQQQNAQTQQFMRDYNARQSAFNQSQMNSNQAARDAQQQRANQSLANAQQNQRNITDTGNLVNDSRSGNSRYYTFCNNRTGKVAYQLDNTAPPDASGDWVRCGN